MRIESIQTEGTTLTIRLDLAADVDRIQGIAFTSPETATCYEDTLDPPVLSMAFHVWGTPAKDDGTSGEEA